MKKFIIFIVLFLLSMVLLILSHFMYKHSKILKTNDTLETCTDTDTTGKKGDKCKIFTNNGCLVGKWLDDISRGGQCDAEKPIVDNTLSKILLILGNILLLGTIIFLIIRSY